MVVRNCPEAQRFERFVGRHEKSVSFKNEKKKKIFYLNAETKQGGKSRSSLVTFPRNVRCEIGEI